MRRIMDEQFDKDIIKRIREVFDNYQDPSAGEGWRVLRKKYPDDRKRRPVAWLWLGTAAAVLLLFVGLWFWIGNQPVQPTKIVSKKAKHTEAEALVGSHQTKTSNHNNTIADETQAGSHQIKAHTPKTAATRETVAASGKPKAANRKTTTNSETLAVASAVKVAPLSNPAQPRNKFNKNDQLTVPKKSYSRDNLAQPTSIPKPNDGVRDQANKTATQQMAVLPQSKPGRPDSANTISQKPKKSIVLMFDDKLLAKSNNEEKVKDATKKVRFAVYAASYFNYAKGSDNQVNLGAGFSTEISLNKHLSLVTGVAIGQNTLNYSGSASFAAVPGSNSLLAAAASNYYGPSSYNVNTVSPTLKNYNANLVGLDIPLNLKYVFDPQKRDTYFIAGLSSGTFINETYTSQYNYPAQQTQDQTSRNSFNSFYFAKTLNVAFGTGFTLGKNRLVLEPFLKYPLEGLGVQQLRFGATGLNLKFNFQSKK